MSKQPAQSAFINLKLLITHLSLMICAFDFAGCGTPSPADRSSFQGYVLDYHTPTDPQLQAALEDIDAQLRGRFGMHPEQTAVGLLDLNRLRLAMIQPDRI